MTTEQSQTPFSLVPNEPSLNDLLNLLKKEILFDLQAHHVGTIQSFNSVKQTVTATINYTQTFFQLNTESGLYDNVETAYPVLVDCPIVVLSGGPVAFTLPIAKGDECLLLFNDRDIDNWFNGSYVGPPNSSRAHSFSDAFALVGVNSLANVIQAYDTVRALVTNGTVMLGINPSTNKVTLTNGTSLNSLLQNLLTQLQNLTTALGVLTVTGITGGIGTSGVPTNATTITGIGTNIGTIATQIGGLLE